MTINRRDFLATATVATSLAVVAGRAPAQTTGKRYKACVIGDSTLGGYGHYIHLAFALRDDVATVGLADPDEAGRARYAEETGAERTYADYREMLDKERPDLVAVGPRCSINHRDYILACAEVGAHGFMEKPLSIDLEEADAMIGAIEAKNLKWSIAYNVRTTPIIQHVKHKVVEEGLIGTVLEARARGKEDRRAGGEDLIVLGTHVLDLMRFFLDGEPAWCASDITVEGESARPTHVREATEPLGPIVGDRIHSLYGFAGGQAGHFDSMASPEGGGGRFGIDLYGSRGVITIRIGAEPVVRWLDDPTWAPGITGKAWQPIPDAPQVVVEDAMRERNRPITDDLIAAIQEDRLPAVSLQDGRAAQEMIQAVFASHVVGGRVTMPLERRAHPLKGWS